MFKILNETFRTGIVTTRYPKAAANVAEGFRGLPKIDFESWRDSRPRRPPVPLAPSNGSCWIA